MSVVASLGLLAFATAPFAAGELRSAWNLRDHIPLEQIIVQGHREAGALMPEDSLEAFESAWKLGTIPEGDLRTARDRAIVAFHDEDCRRILSTASPEDQQRGIKDLRWDEVARLDIGAWKGEHFAGQRVPRVSQICKVPQRRLMDLGVAGFATEHPDVAMKTIRE